MVISSCLSHFIVISSLKTGSSSCSYWLQSCTHLYTSQNHSGLHTLYALICIWAGPMTCFVPALYLCSTSLQWKSCCSALEAGHGSLCTEASIYRKSTSLLKTTLIPSWPKAQSSLLSPTHELNKRSLFFLPKNHFRAQMKCNSITNSFSQTVMII